MLAAALASGCSPNEKAASAGAAARDRAIGDTLRSIVVNAYSLADSNVVARFMSLYPATGRVVSASGGRIAVGRDTIRLGIERFYDRVARNMRNPVWEWGPMYVDVLSSDAAVLSAEYRVPHRTPEGEPHTIAGAWTAIFARRGGRWTVVQEHLSDRAEPGQ
jgi:ketosteroid isomerase-like protein